MMHWSIVRRRGIAPLIGALVICVLPLGAGCNRGHYRVQADREVYCAVETATSDSRWALDDFTIRPDPASRMYDPHNPDCEPMPPDDPDSHGLMHCVDGKRGWKHWHRYGDTPYVENPIWRAYLPRDARGQVVLDRAGAIHLALLHSREYQRMLEELYLSALSVTLQRFAFDTQFFGGTATFYTADGPLRSGNSRSELRHDNTLEARRLLASGGNLVVGLANAFVWQFSGPSGPDSYQTNTLLSGTFLQPLLREGGRAVVLESLTESERALLANLRQMEQFRRGFYTQITTGRGPGPGPSRGGPSIPSISTAVATAGGFLGLLRDQIVIFNQEVNLAFTRDSLNELEARSRDPRLDPRSAPTARLQVEQTRQALFETESALVSLEADYQDRLDSFKIQLGLPPDLDVQVSDPLLERLYLIDPATWDMYQAVDDLLTKLRHKEEPLPADFAAKMRSIRETALEQLNVVQRDLEALEAALPERRESLRRLAEREEVRSGQVSAEAYDLAKLVKRAGDLATDYRELAKAIRQSLDDLTDGEGAQGTAPVERAPLPKGAQAADPVRERMTAAAENLSAQTLQLIGIQAGARVYGVPLVSVGLTSEEAFRIARENRPDWMNARAALVDAWRQIEIAANALQSDLNVRVYGDVNTVDNNPVNFRGSTGRLQVGVEFDAPLTRVAERNAYRSAQIAYQQARREYYAFEDRIHQSLRSTLRDIRLSQLDFELRRAAVYVAVDQLNLTLLRMKQPPGPGQTSQQVGATTARDVQQALSALRSAQNSFLTGWLNYEIQRMNLDFDMGTMQLDASGMWIDPGPIEAGYAGPEMREDVEPSEPAPLRAEGSRSL